MGGLKGNIVVYAALVLLPVASVWAGRSYKITDVLDPLVSVYLSLGLMFAAGFVAGAAVLHIFSSLRAAARNPKEVRHAR